MSKCTQNAGSSDAQTDLWNSIYGAPIADRLNAPAPGANLATVDIFNLIQLRALETVTTCTLRTCAELFNFNIGPI
ncbi:hypothetical protein BYT27DRAFT_7202616 [Phlegmacium glaucopus]|nr:hypothetical protein BYT27DRAFT_7202616 [Phlegmacium glaucopus]